MALLYQFAGSHYCEKARWALDFKGVPHGVRNLVPGPHMRVARTLATGTSLPIYVDGDVAIQGSAAIIDHLDKSIRARQLTPTNTEEASRAREMERYLDNNLGVHLRRFFYCHAFRDRRYVTDFLTRDGPWWGRPFLFVAFPTIRREMQSRMNVSEESLESSRAALMVAFDHLDERIKNRKFLAGAYFSRADLTAASMLFHWWREEWTPTHGMRQFYETVKSRPFVTWAQSIYREYRSVNANG